ncbi:MAG: sodium-dependent transporter [Desulfovibrio sp.]
MKRDQWGSRIGFILAAVGSAIGLGNIWRFPYMAYENGGGAFFIPYLFAMLTAGIPFMILEFGIGSKYRLTAPRAFATINSKMEWLGWWQVMVAFAIMTYYSVVIGWTTNYTVFAFTQAWGTDTANFFLNDYLGNSGSVFKMGGIQLPIFLAVTFTWAVTWFVTYSGVKNGIERACKVLMPVLFILVLVFISRAITLEGATTGLQYLFQPDFSKIMDYKVWAAAYGQIFYTLSVGFAIMIAYSSYLPKKSDIANNACMTVFINCGFSILGGVMIFSILGYMAAQQNVAVGEVVGSGVGLAFITIPKAINLMPAPVFFGVLFFLALTLAGVSSLISLAEACLSAFMDKFSMTRKKSATILCLAGYIFSVLYTTEGGLTLLDIVDHFINSIALLACCFAELVFLGWFFNLDGVQKYINEVSDFTVGALWKFCIKFISISVLGYVLVGKLIEDINTPYGGYPMNELLLFGWCVAGMTILGGFIIASRKNA